MRAAEGLQTPSRAIYNWVQELIDESGIRLDQLDCLAFGAGPGSFTGVRVAAAVVQALGFARRVARGAGIDAGGTGNGRVSCFAGTAGGLLSGCKDGTGLLCGLCAR